MASLVGLCRMDFTVMAVTWPKYLRNVSAHILQMSAGATKWLLVTVHNIVTMGHCWSPGLRLRIVNSLVLLNHCLSSCFVYHDTTSCSY